MKEIDFKYIEELWQRNKYPLNVYVHSPYCKSLCDYCVYKGNLLDNNFDYYFNEILPNSINKYKNIILNNKVRSIYFGGGTPNFNSDLSNLIPALNALKDIKCSEKIIELHMGIEITDEVIDLLHEYNFNTVVLCQQTFNSIILKKHNRINTNKNNIKTIVEKFHNVGIKCGLDLLYFTDEPIKVLIDDINTAINANLDEITIAPIYSFRTNISYGLFSKAFSIFEGAGYKPDTILNENTWGSVKVFRWFKEELYDDSFLHESTNFYSFINGLDDCLPSYPTYTSVLGIGSFNNKIKKTYSNINNQYFYCENFNGEDTKYYLLRDKSFYDIMREIIDWAEKNSTTPVPSGTSFIFRNIDYSNYNKDFEEAQYNFSINIPTEDSFGFIQNLNRNKDKLIHNGLENRGSDK